MGGTVILSSLGGIIAFCGAVIIIGRGIFRQTEAVKANTKALEALPEQINKLIIRLDGHDIDIAVLKDRMKR
jgi:hypothetical protein